MKVHRQDSVPTVHDTNPTCCSSVELGQAEIAALSVEARQRIKLFLCLIGLHTEHINTLSKGAGWRAVESGIYSVGTRHFSLLPPAFSWCPVRLTLRP
jgi:hypothetical protein